MDFFSIFSVVKIRNFILLLKYKFNNNSRIALSIFEDNTIKENENTIKHFFKNLFLIVRLF